MCRPGGGSSRDETPSPHSTHSPADEPWSASAMRGVGGILTEELEDSSQGEGGALGGGRTEIDHFSSKRKQVKVLFFLNNFTNSHTTFSANT